SRTVFLALAGAAGIVAAAGCVHYRAEPIAPEDTLAAFSARSLADAGLRQFLTANRCPVPRPGAPWALKPLTLAAFYFNPDLDVARAELAAAEAARLSAGERANPALAASAGYDSTTSTRLVSPWILTFSLDVPLTTAGKRAHRVAEARSSAEAARLGLAAAAWEVRSRVRAALVELHASIADEGLLADQERVSMDGAVLLEQQLRAGAVSAFEVTQARLALSSAQLAHRDAVAREIAARAQLADALGLPLQALGGTPLSFADLAAAPAEVATAEARRQAVLNRADVLAALAAYAASQAALQLEIARQYPDLSLGPGYEFDQGDNKWILGVSLPLPLVSRNRGPIAEAEARRKAAAARFLALQAHAVAEVDAAVAAYDAARASAEAAEAIGHDLDAHERRSEARFEAGEISRLELDGARLERITAGLARLDALARRQAALGRLEDAMQRSTEPGEWVAAPRARDDAASAPGAGVKR
ncbi:MAG TPA: TolC family protein, partial [Thermoanaerobaculaceae bacterium]|nr:TolC family protein [Thermoanaerobaculaceae bacterium]